MNSTYRPDIDGLRAIAVLGVVLFHLKLGFLPGGFLGVDVFFVISGYLITRIIHREVLETGTFRFGRFYLRRVRRLFPALAATLLASALAGFVILSPVHFAAFGGELVSAVLSVSNVYYFNESGYFDMSVDFKSLLHTWSLSVEEQFYLFWPLALLACLRLAPRRLAWFLLAAIVIGVVLADGHTPRNAAFYLTPFRVFEFAIGALLVPLERWRSKAGLVWHEAGLLAGLVLIAVSFVGFSEETRLPGFLSLVPAVGAAFVIQCGSTASLFGRLVANRPMAALGSMSYSFYLVHWPLIVFAGYLSFQPLSAVARSGLFLAMLALAYLSYRFVEQPFRRPAARNGTNAPFLVGSAMTACLCVLIGAAVLTGQGWPWRLDPKLATLVESPDREVVYQTECQYVVTDIDEALQKRFDDCTRRYGKAVLVFGDSHAADLANAMSVNGTRPHVVGVSRPTCRPYRMRSYCFYPRLAGFLQHNREELTGAVFTQNGFALTDGEKTLAIDQPSIDQTSDFLVGIASIGVPLVWVGPQWEPYFAVEKYPALVEPIGHPDYLANNLAGLTDVDSAIQRTLRQRKPPFAYVSKFDILGPMSVSTLMIDGEYTYSDDDHWSAKGEEAFGERLLAGSAVLRDLFGDRTAD